MSVGQNENVNDLYNVKKKSIADTKFRGKRVRGFHIFILLGKESRYTI